MENKINLPPFYPYQKVVALSNRIVQITKGKEYVIKNQSQLSCGCWVVEVGVQREDADTVHCGRHGESHKIAGKNWIDHSLFAPIEQTFQSISFEKVIEKEAPLIGVN